MKNVIGIMGMVLLISCSSTRFVDSWKNKEIASFQPQKLLVIGMTDNLTARKIFEEELQTALSQRGMKAFESEDVLERSFTDSKKSEEEIDAMTNELSKEGFDAVILTAVKGIDEIQSYDHGYYTIDYRWVRFGRYYYRYQDVFYTPGYYDDYKVYHIETSVYNINQEEDRSLVWVGSFDIVNPQTISATVKDYVSRIILQLEKEGVINRLN